MLPGEALIAHRVVRPMYGGGPHISVRRRCAALAIVPHRALLLYPLVVNGEPRGALGFFWKSARGRLTPNARQFVAAAACQLSLALERANLAEQLGALAEQMEHHRRDGTRTLERAYAKLRSSRDELRVLSAHVERVRERERARIAREIHDELGQALTALKIDLSRLSQEQAGHESRVNVAQFPAVVDGMMSTVRRIASELRPHLLDDLGLVAALEWQAQDFVRRTGVKCRFRCRGTPDRLDENRSTALFRIFQEILTNIARHAQATQVHIALAIGERSARLEVNDNGCGIPAEPMSNEMRLGLLGMQERAAACGGRVTIGGVVPSGTRVQVRIPLPRLSTSDA